MIVLIKVKDCNQLLVTNLDLKIYGMCFTRGLQVVYQHYAISNKYVSYYAMPSLVQYLQLRNEEE